MSRKEIIRTCCVVALTDLAEMHKDLFPNISVKKYEGHFNRKKKAMFLVLDHEKRELSLQSKVEEHAGGRIVYQRIPVSQMRQMLLSNYKLERDFQLGTDKSTGKQMYWITDPNAKSKRQPLHTKPVRAYKRVGNKAEYVGELFVNFNDIKKVFVD